jgi:hypothetical protein
MTINYRSAFWRSLTEVELQRDQPRPAQVRIPYACIRECVCVRVCVCVRAACVCVASPCVDPV